MTETNQGTGKQKIYRQWQRDKERKIHKQRQWDTFWQRITGKETHSKIQRHINIDKDKLAVNEVISLATVYLQGRIVGNQWEQMQPLSHASHCSDHCLLLSFCFISSSLFICMQKLQAKFWMNLIHFLWIINVGKPTVALWGKYEFQI